MQPETLIDMLWRPRALVWALLVVLGLALVLALAPGTHADPLPVILRRFGLFAFFGAWVMVLALAGIHAIALVSRGLGLAGIAASGLVAMLAATALVSAVVIAFLPDAPGTIPPAALFWRACVIALTVGGLSVGAFHTLARNQQLQEQARRSEHAALQARVDPHFLFNTLNTAIGLVRQRPELAESVLHDLSDLFRAALSASREIPLAQELQLCRRYLDIEQLRLGDRLRVEWNETASLPGAMPVPALLVQPLVENAVRHGIEPSGDGGDLRVDIDCTRDDVRVRISNPLPPPSARVPGHHIGQSAVQARIAVATQGRGNLHTEIAEGRYVATLRLPLAPARI